jgi:hypothetical protein
LPPIALPPSPPIQAPKVELFEEEEFQKAKKLKTKIIQIAGALGFSYQEEKHLPDQKRIDLVLQRGAATLAVEICVTTQVEHEVRNVLKCIQFGYDRIFHICQSKIRRAAILNQTRQKITAAEFERVQFVSYGEFVKFIKELSFVNKPGEPTTPPKTIPGPKAKLSPEEEQSEPERLLEELRRRLKRNKGDNPPNPS